MPLINFGSILGFAEEIERQNLDFLNHAAANPACSAHKSLLEEMVKTGEKRIKEIQRVRRENVTEMILESIEGFFRDPYRAEVSEASDPDGAVGSARLLLGRTVKYYGDAALKLKGQSEVSRALKTLGKKCKRDLDRLPG